MSTCLPCDPEILCFQKKVTDPEAQNTLESHLPCACLLPGLSMCTDDAHIPRAQADASPEQPGPSWAFRCAGRSFPSRGKGGPVRLQMLSLSLLTSPGAPPA